MIHDIITILCHVGFTILQVVWALQPNLFPYYKDKAFQGKKRRRKKEWQIFRPKWVKIKIFVIILSLLLKNKYKETHYNYT